MLLFKPEPEIDENEGFSPTKDIFGRRSAGNSLTSLIMNANQNLVISLDGPWGCGKTTFLKMWAGELRNKNIPVIYFDAFENDFRSDAFVALAAQIIALAENKAPNKDKSNFLEKAKSVGKIVARSSLKIGIKLATQGLADSVSLENVGKEIASESSAAFDKHIGEILTNFNKEENIISTFKDSLRSLVNSIGDENKYLVFIIDELDRARPDFSLEILERIKHFFSMDNIKFVIGMNTSQMESTIKGVYGQETDAKTYLQKFIHIRFNLEDNIDEYTNTQSAYVEFLGSEMKFPKLKENSQDYMLKILGEICVSKKLTLRNIERIMSELAVAIASTSDNQYCPPEIMAGIAVIKVNNPNLFNKLLNKIATIEEIEIELGISENNEKLTYLKTAQEGWNSLLGAFPPEEIQRNSNQIRRYGFHDRRDAIPFLARRFSVPNFVRFKQG